MNGVDQRVEESVELSGRHRLVIVRQPGHDMVQFLSRHGEITLSVILTEAGPVLRFDGASLVLQATGSLSIEADQLRLHGHDGLSLTTDGDLSIRAQGDASTEARIQNITATLGNVNVRANDDVKMSGERIRMNS